MTGTELKRWAEGEYRDEALASCNHEGPLERGIYQQALPKMLEAASQLDVLSEQLAIARADWRKAEDRAARSERIIDRLLSNP